MPLKPLAGRIESLPTVLAGPIVRRTELTRVTVWIALRKPQKVTLRIYDQDADTIRLEGTRSTLPVGTALHLVAVTAKLPAQPPPPPAQSGLTWGRIYRYNLFFGDHSNDAVAVPAQATNDLFAAGVVAADASKAREVLCYSGPGAPTLPSFALSPEKLAGLRLLHGSCRKPHGGGEDALAAANLILAATAADPTKRPHQLFLTGDQIYADDVADALLAAVTDAGDTLLGWAEALPGVDKPAKDVMPGTRQVIAAKVAGLSADPAKSQLFGFGEFCAMFLFAWSEVLWPDALPDFATVRPAEHAIWNGDVERIRRGASSSVPRYSALKRAFEAELEGLAEFRKALPSVRKALANVSTYMIFDDHEISDDWFINLNWCRSVLAKPLGRRVIRNGLTAFALFEAWGNTPTQFDADSDGAAFLAAVTKWVASKGADTTADGALTKAVGPPALASVQSTGRLMHGAGSLDWHYTVAGPKHEVLVLDTRTWRSYSAVEADPPALFLEDDVYAKQVGAAAPNEAELTFVVSPTPVIGIPLAQGLQAWAVKAKLGDAALFDAEGWGLHAAAFEKLLARLLTRVEPASDGARRARVVVLSGDVHYGFAGRLSYRGDAPFTAAPKGPVDGVVVQLTSSSLKNEDAMTRGLHQFGFQNWFSRLLEVIGFDQPLPSFRRAGWANAGGAKITVGEVDELGTPDDQSSSLWTVNGSPAVTSYTVSSLDRHGTAHPVAGLRLERKPEWEYEVEYVGSHKTQDRAAPTEPVAALGADTRVALTTSYAPAAANVRRYHDFLGAGMEIVGRTNLGEITFRADGAATAIVQRLWWVIPAQLFVDRAPQPLPLTEYVIPLPGRHAIVPLALRVDRAGAEVPLENAWIYRRDGSTTRVLRTDASGALFGAATSSDRPWDYTDPVAIAAGTKATLAFSRGAKPVPDSVLAAHPDVFAEYTVPTSVPPVVVLRDALIEMTRPVELSLWPLLWELPPPAYAPIQTGPALWDDAGQVPSEYQPAPPPDAVRPRERGLRIEGRVAADATAVAIELHGAAGPLPLRASIDPTAPTSTELVAALAAPGSDARAFSADVFVAGPAAFGPVRIVIRPQGVQRIDAFAVQLCGLQLALVEDDLAQQRGQVPSEADERAVVDFEVSPQQAAAVAPLAANLTTQTRTRRMVVYEITTGRRPLAVGGAAVPMPQMPMWMGEVQFVGVPRPELEELMQRRHFRDHAAAAGPPVTLRIEFSWRLSLEWDGPDSNAPAFPAILQNQIAFSHRDQFPAAGPETVTALLHFGARGQPTDAAGIDLEIPASGAVPNAWTIAPAVIRFPVANRRLPAFVVASRDERWGRSGAGDPVAAVVAEFQPRIAAADGREIIRGGDGTLEVLEVRIDGSRIDPGLVRSGAGAAPPPAADPALRSPPFRVRGRGPSPLPVNPPANILVTPPPATAPNPPIQVGEMEQLIRLLVQQHFNANAAQPRVALLPLACWEETIVRIFRHESGIANGYFQFDERRAGRRRYARNNQTFFFGTEYGMPLFGPPHGFGIGQLDNFFPPVRGVNADEAWNFIENLRTAIRIVMDEKAQGAFNFVNGSFLPNPSTQLVRAVYQREIVRRYNGFTEFVFVNNTYRVRPSFSYATPGNPADGPNQNLRYPNHVLGTNMVYWQGQPANTGAATQFTFLPPLNAQGGILFGDPMNPNAAHADYGPGT